MPRTDDTMAVANAASYILDRLTDRATELSEACSRAKPSDLDAQSLRTIQDEDNIFEELENDR